MIQQLCYDILFCIDARAVLITHIQYYGRQQLFESLIWHHTYFAIQMLLFSTEWSN